MDSKPTSSRVESPNPFVIFVCLFVCRDGSSYPHNPSGYVLGCGSMRELFMIGSTEKILLACLLHRFFSYILLFFSG